MEFNRYSVCYSNVLKLPFFLVFVPSNLLVHRPIPSYCHTGTHHLIFIGPCVIVTVQNKRPTWCHLLFLFHVLCAQHVSDINISIIRSLRLFCWIITLVVCFWFDVCWFFSVVCLEWYPCCRQLRLHRTLTYNHI